MRKLLTLTLVIVLGLFTFGCDDSASSSSSATDSESTRQIASYSTAWYDNGNSTSSYYYNIRYSVTEVPFEGIEYEVATSDFKGPLNSIADVNYVGTANVSSDPYLTHWSDGTSTYSTKAFDGVTYTRRTFYNNDNDSYVFGSYESYVMYEGTALEGTRDDYILEGDTYVNKNTVDNDGYVSRFNDND
ncbi:MAG: hypothetical protein LBH59_11585 [Planctomycetaceae bacterium]|jgi:hypothetical protein|nr:hypothetical protein [Planctomycetaceae bacterium]